MRHLARNCPSSRKPRASFPSADAHGSTPRNAGTTNLSTTLYIDAAAQLALTRRLDSLASNLANANTTGFLGDGLKFDSVLSATGATNVAFPIAGADYISLAPGAAHRTGNPLDVAVRGEGWLSVMTPDGPAYTRDGRLFVDPTGEVRSVNGYPFLDSGGAPMMIDPSGGDISIAVDGSVHQRGKAVASIGIFALDAAARLRRYDNSAVLSDRQAEPAGNFAKNGLMQGYLHRSNVDPLSEMSRLIEIQRAFDHISACLSMTDNAQQESIRSLGSQA